MDEEIQQIVLALERGLPEQKLDLVQSFLERFGLNIRVIAREPKVSDKQITQMQGAIEIFVRCLDQRRDYLKGVGVGRPDSVFIELLLELGALYNIVEDVRESLLYAGKKIKAEGMVN